ncbi:MAG: penicillin acylase family protein [Puia sp.]
MRPITRCFRCHRIRWNLLFLQTQSTGFRGVIVKAPAGSDSLYLQKKDTLSVKAVTKPDRDNGSNNWAVSGIKTKSGSPILCNDPHLGLHLPSLWYEMQVSCPTMNFYGVTLPGSPGVVIGFNDSCAFGLTNGGRDVRDYYEITFKDDSKKEYLFNGKWVPSDFRYEHIKIKDSVEYIDTVAYTIFGPVMYDKNFRAAEKQIINTIPFAGKGMMQEMNFSHLTVLLMRKIIPIIRKPSNTFLRQVRM